MLTNIIVQKKFALKSALDVIILFVAGERRLPIGQTGSLSERTVQHYVLLLGRRLKTEAFLHRVQRTFREIDIE